VTGVTRQHLPVGPAFGELRQRDDLHRYPFEVGAEPVTHDRLAGELRPQAAGGAVVHHQVGVPQPPGRPEVEHLPVDGAFEHQTRVAQRAVRDDQRLPGNHVVDDLVEGEDRQGVGAGVAVQVDDEHGIARLQPLAGGCHVLEQRRVDGWDPIRWRPAGPDLLQRHRRRDLLAGGGALPRPRRRSIRRLAARSPLSRHRAVLGFRFIVSAGGDRGVRAGGCRQRDCDEQRDRAHPRSSVQHDRSFV
jgi:hypothetical protein